MAKIIYINYMQVARGAKLELHRHNVGIATRRVIRGKLAGWLAWSLLGWIVLAGLAMVGLEMAKVARIKVELDRAKMGASLDSRDQREMRREMWTCVVAGDYGCASLGHK